ncbi:MAG TPA: hypothetical protein VEL47_04670 [Myxococcota bacterium]|nr:hypothetical protein [Myxococcota bacterium]
MSAKNQRTLFISAFVIIALTIVGLASLNFAVEKISQIKPPTIAMAEPKKSTDDMLGGPKNARENKAGPNGLQSGMPKNFDMGMHPPGFMQNRPPMMPPDMQKRLRNGRDAPDMRRAKPPTGSFMGGDSRGPNQGPPTRDTRDRNMMPMPPMPDFNRMSPAEREQFEREMERRREQFFGSPDHQPPPGYPPPYYPPPPGYDGPGGYDGGQGYDDYYDGDYDYEGDMEGRRFEPRPDPKRDVRLSDYAEELDYDEEDPDYGPEDEYYLDEME